MHKIPLKDLALPKYTVLFATLAALSPLGMDSYLPAIPLFSESLGVSSEAASWTLSNFLIGLGLGQLSGGALSDQVGRRPVAVAGIFLFLLSCVAIVLFPNFTVALIFRFIQGFGGGLLMVAGISMLKDSTLPAELAERMSQAVFIIMITPIVAPIIGTLLLPLGWPSIFIMCGLAACVLGVFLLIRVPETHLKKSGQVSLRQAIRQFNYVITHKAEGKRIALFQWLSMSLGSTVILSFVTVAPEVLMGQYGLDEVEFTVCFSSIIIAILIGNRIGKRALKFYTPAQVFSVAYTVELIFVTFFVVVVHLLDPPVYIFILLIMLNAGSFSVGGPSAQSLFLNILDKYHGSAAALENTTRFSLGGVLGGLALFIPFSASGSISFIQFLSILVGYLLFRKTLSYWKLQEN